MKYEIELRTARVVTKAGYAYHIYLPKGLANLEVIGLTVRGDDVPISNEYTVQEK